MRVSNQMMNHMLSSNIQDNQSAVYQKEQQIASGKKITLASEDPALWARATRLHNEKAELEQYARNSGVVGAQLEALDQSLVDISSSLKNVSEMAIQGADGTLSANDRLTLSKQMGAMLEQLVSQANQEYNGKYQFGGVQSDAPPFEVTRNADGQIDSVTYVGAEATTQVEIAEGDALSGQLAGAGVRGVIMSDSTDPFAPIIQMRDRLAAGENLAGSGLQTQVDSALEHVIVSRGSIGAQLEHVKFVSDIRMDRDVMLNQSISDTEDVDIAEAVTELSAKQTAYEAALAMASKTINLSLLNYI